MTTVFVVPHTHWDREWYEPAARFRQRLVPVVDEILDVLDRDADYSCFLLDGQAAILDDYLEMRPERRPAVERLARSGRLLVGPWYVLSDEFISSDECLVRNLLAGKRVAGAMGGWLPLGYSPDAFGHPAALPTVLSGFGIRHGILWRGYGGEPGQEGDLFRWVGPDGASVTFHHLPPDGYEAGSGLPRDPGKLVERWARLDTVLAPRAGKRPRLVTVGADHHGMDVELPRLLASLQQVTGHEFRIASPLDYFATIGETTDAPQLRGELRFSHRYAWTLPGVLATRAGLKRRIAEGDRLLVDWAEPQIALASLKQSLPLLRTAWREHLLNHPHDSLGGCVTDAVARDVAARAGSVVTQAQGLLSDALHARLRQDRTVARREPGRWESSLVLVNPRPTAFSGVVEATLTVFQDHVPVGPGSANRTAPPTPPVVAPSLVGPDGNEVPRQVLGRWDAFERLDSPYDYPDQDRVRAFRVAIRAQDVPALGLQALKVVPERGRVRPVLASSEAVRPPFAALEAVDLVSDRDEGDTYTFQPVEKDRPLRTTWSAPRVVWPGPLVAAVSRDGDVSERVRLTVFARADAGSEMVRYVVEGDNLAGNHRLRFIVPVAGAATAAMADMQYGPVARERRQFERSGFPQEWPVSTEPMHRYVSAGGTTVFARGCFEYELLGDAIAVTVFRAVGDLSRGDLAARPGHAGWPMSTPEAQEPGPFRVEFAVAQVGVDAASTAEDWDRIERLADEFHTPCTGLMLRYGIDVPASVGGPALSGEGLSFKALKIAEDGVGLIARCVNLTETAVKGSWHWHERIRRAARVRLDESEIEALETATDRRVVGFEAGPREIVSIRIVA